MKEISLSSLSFPSHQVTKKKKRKNIRVRSTFDINYNVVFSIIPLRFVRYPKNNKCLCDYKIQCWSAVHRIATRKLPNSKKETQSNTRILQNRALFHFLAPLTYQNDEKKKKREKGKRIKKKIVGKHAIRVICLRVSFLQACESAAYPRSDRSAQ